MITDLTRTFDVHGVQIAWDRFGSHGGVPLLLCHGFSGSSHDFASHVEELASRCDVVVLDHRGHGASTKLGTVEGYSIEQLSRDLVAFVDGAVGSPVDLLGHSMGGAVSINLTLARPDLVRSLILMDTTGWSFQPNDPGIRSMLEAFIAAYDPANGLPDLTSMAGPEEALITAATTPQWQELKAIRSAAFDPCAMKALGTELFTAPEADRERLAAITAPVTVIVGEHDHPFVDQAQELAGRVPNGALSVIAGAYHSPQLTHPAEWAAAVHRHLDRVG